jgi:hypothetical protein
MNMRSVKLVAAAVGLSMVLWGATPAFAGHGHGEYNAFAFGKGGKHGGGREFGFGKGGKHGGRHEFGFGRADKHGGGHHYGYSGNSHGNKHGEYRGFERANEVAGPHGQRGRDNAAFRHSEGHSYHGNHDE